MNTVRTHQLKALTLWNIALDLAEAVHALFERLPADAAAELAGTVRHSVMVIVTHLKDGRGYGITPRYVRSLRAVRRALERLDEELLFGAHLAPLDAAGLNLARARIHDLSELSRTLEAQIREALRSSLEALLPQHLTVVTTADETVTNDAALDPGERVPTA